tara:strand:- start:1076 stop:1756 length:681 start_codon:yes stop_codon:yes gene_type:complete
VNPKTVCISGVSKGLGKALSIEFDQRGWQVAGCARTTSALIKLGSQLSNSHFFRSVDITNLKQVLTFSEEVIENLGSPTLLVNNAGKINSNARLHEVSEDEFLEVFKVNVCGTHNMIKAFLPKMKGLNQGLIVNFSSYWGQSTAAEVAPYCASKWAIEGLTRALAQELPSNLSTVALNPGVIDTDMLRSCFGDAAGSHEKPRDWAKHAVDCLENLNKSDNGNTVIA